MSVAAMKLPVVGMTSHEPVPAEPIADLATTAVDHRIGSPTGQGPDLARAMTPTPAANAVTAPTAAAPIPASADSGRGLPANAVTAPTAAARALSADAQPIPAIDDSAAPLVPNTGYPLWPIGSGGAVLATLLVVLLRRSGRHSALP